MDLTGQLSNLSEPLQTLVAPRRSRGTSGGLGHVLWGMPGVARYAPISCWDSGAH